MTMHSTAQHSTAQHSTAQHSTAQHSTAQHSTAQHSRPTMDVPTTISILPSLLRSTRVGAEYMYALYLVWSVDRSRCCCHLKFLLRRLKTAMPPPTYWLMSTSLGSVFARPCDEACHSLHEAAKLCMPFVRQGQFAGVGSLAK
jgi:hypothetical protein